MRLLSWNLFGLSDHHLDLRTEAAMFRALLGGPPDVVLAGGKVPAPPDVLMFQEVVERSHVAHLRPHLGAAGYTLVPNEPHPEREYYEVVAIGPSQRIVDAERERLDSAQGRELVSVQTELEGDRWLWMTGHLESLQEGARQRIAQVEHVLAKLAAHDGPAVFGGDTNLRASEVSAIERDTPLPDAWGACGEPAAHRWTWTSKRRKARYDRIWGRGVMFSGFRCVGRDAVTPDGLRPSDHLGVEVEIDCLRA